MSPQNYITKNQGKFCQPTIEIVSGNELFEYRIRSIEAIHFALNFVPLEYESNPV